MFAWDKLTQNHNAYFFQNINIFFSKILMFFKNIEVPLLWPI